MDNLLTSFLAGEKDSFFNSVSPTLKFCNLVHCAIRNKNGLGIKSAHTSSIIV